MSQVADVEVAIVLNNQLYTVTVNGAAHDFTSDGTATADEIRDGLVTEINSGAEPVQAFAVAGTTDRLVVYPDVRTATHTYSVSAELTLVIVFEGANPSQAPAVGVEISSTPPPSPTIHLAVRNPTLRESSEAERAGA